MNSTLKDEIEKEIKATPGSSIRINKSRGRGEASVEFGKVISQM